MKYNSILFIMTIMLFSCSKPEVRKPIVHRTSISSYEKSIQLNKEILSIEEKIFKTIVSKDKENLYKASPFGFWYFYNKQVIGDIQKAKTGNKVVINYEIMDVNKNIILSQKELGTKGQKVKEDRLLKIDGEDFILGLHEGIKLMKEGETVTFLLPSNKAFGATGLANVIAPNQPLIIKVTLKQIINNNTKIK